MSDVSGLRRFRTANTNRFSCQLTADGATSPLMPSGKPKRRRISETPVVQTPTKNDSDQSTTAAGALQDDNHDDDRNPFIPEEDKSKSILRRLFNWPKLTRINKITQPIFNFGSDHWFTELTDLVSSSFGGRVVFATDSFFAAAGNLLLEDAPIWKEGLYTEFGKWYDGWETRRKRQRGHDWCIIELGAPGYVYGVEVNTRHFTGNYAPAFSLEGINLPSLSADIEDHLDDIQAETFNPGTFGSGYSADENQAVEDVLAHRAEDVGEPWEDLVPVSALGPGDNEKSAKHFFSVTGSNRLVTHVRLNLFPDGGIARLRIYGCAKIQQNSSLTQDLALAKNGAIILACSNAHFGHPRNLLRSDPPLSMKDGWETARHTARPPILHEDHETSLISNFTNEDWCIVRLGCRGIISHIEIDTSFFKGNAPESCTLEGVDLTDPIAQLPLQTLIERVKGDADLPWRPLIASAKLGPDCNNVFTANPKRKERGRSPRRKREDETPQRPLDNVAEPVSLLRLRIVPDGGIARLRVRGTPKPTGSI